MRKAVSSPPHGSLPEYFARPQDVPTDEVEEAMHVLKSSAKGHLHFAWMEAGYRALRAGVERQTGSSSPELVHSHEDAIAAFQDSCLHQFLPAGEKDPSTEMVLRRCKYCGIEKTVARAY